MSKSKLPELTIAQTNARHNLAELISKRRKEIGIEQVDIEDYTGLSVSTLSRLENSKANISFDSLISVLDLLGLEMQIRIKKTV